MAGLLKERARKPIIAPEIGIAHPSLKRVGDVTHFVVEIREPWSQDGYQRFEVLLTEKEMLETVSAWLQFIAKAKP
jgi:hypothetical protein